MAILLEIIFKVIGYTLFLYGLWLTAGIYLVNNYFKIWYTKYKRNKQLRRIQYLNSTNSKQEKDEHSKLYEYLDMLLKSSVLKYNLSVSTFIALTVILFTVTTILMMFLLRGLVLPLIVGAFVASIPYLLIIYRLETIRLSASYAFIYEFHVILQTYQGTNKNIYYVLMQTVDNLDNTNLKRLFRKLIVAFQKDRTDEDFKRSIKIFMYAVSSTFSQRFGNLVIKAHLDDIDIGDSLIDLNSDIVTRKNQLDSEKTNKFQTIILGFSPIVLLPVSVFFAYKLTGVVDFWYFFLNKESLSIFTIATLLSVVSVLLSLLYRKPKTNL